MATMGPMLAAMQLGSAVGHLARTTMGSYELPIPRADPSRLLLVPANIARFAGDWGLAIDEVRLWVCLRELTMHAVVTRAHVADRLRSLLEEFMSGAARDAGGLDVYKRQPWRSGLTATMYPGVRPIICHAS